MDTNTTGNAGGKPTEAQGEDKQRLPHTAGEVEKGSGYGPPGQGSGETVSQDSLTNDGNPLYNGAGVDPDLSKSDQIESEDNDEEDA